jgi:hypothetical protein
MATNRNRLSTTEFISKIIHDADTGESFVPLIGSGLSSPSGIIMGMEFTNYLAFTMYLLLEEPSNRPRTYGEGETSRWDLVQKGWPPLPSPEEVVRAKTWIRLQFEKLCERLGLEINPDDKADCAMGNIKSVVQKRGKKQSQDMRSALTYPKIPTILRSAGAEQIDDYSRRIIDLLARDIPGGHYAASFAIDELVPDPTRSYHNRIIEMGIRALHDWRETLVFLSMIGVDPISGNRLIRKERDSSVIDAFNLFITRDKQPNLGHKLLSHLASPLRIQTILTTNFDTLTEEAYRALSMSLRVLPVSARGRLPEARTVASEDSLVKLHGEAQDTRADLSLDDEPSAEDKATFAAYLTRGAGNLQSNRIDKTRLQAVQSKRLLIVGYSGSDYRCVQMIRHWLETNTDAVVYWICFSANDVTNVRSLFGDSIYDGKIRITQSSRPDLLLYELYQRLVLSLPPGGLTYEFSHIVPPRRLRSFDFGEEQVRIALDCGAESGKPLESARILLGDTGSAVDAKRLARDAIAMRVKEVIVDASLRKLVFYKPDNTYIPPSARADRFVKFAQWVPRYRDPDSKCENREKDKGTLEGLKARPVLLDAPGGVVRASAIAFDELSSTGKKIFWIDTQDYMDADGLLRDFLRGIALRFGSFQSRHVTLHPLSEPITKSLERIDPDPTLVAKELGKFVSEILDDYRADSDSVIVFLYGRDGYGGCSGLTQSNWRPKDRSAQSPNKIFDSFDALHCVIEALAIANIQVIYFPLLTERAERKVQSIESMQVKSESSQNGDELYAKGMNDWAKHSQEPSLPMQWTADPCVDDSIAITNVRVPVFKAMITQVLAPFFTYDSLEASVLVPRFERMTQDGEKRLMFLYAITLFRHSRHPNALCSEATFPCPFRHNASSLDNDFIRSEESSKWLTELRKARVFFDKPGGSLWMHRDARIAIQRLLEQSPLGAPASGGPNEILRRRNHHFSELRSRMHFWIGDWYFKAFCSSGHLTPVIEALHHRIMAAVYSPLARPKTVKPSSAQVGNPLAYRIALFESSILECCKTILVAWHWLHLWQACSFEASWVTETHRESVCKLLRETIPKMFLNSPVPSTSEDKTNRTDETDRMMKAVDQFEMVLRSLAESLTSEGGGVKTTSPRVDPYTTSILETTQSPGSPVLNLDHSIDMINSPRKEVKGLNNQVVTKGFEDELNKTFSGVARNSWGDIFDQLKKVSARDQKMVDREQRIAELSESKARWKAASSTTTASIREMVWLLGESSYVFLRRAKLNYHATGCLDVESWLFATETCNLGIDLCKHLPPSLIDFETSSKIMLHTLYSIALANLGRFFESNRHLNEAQGVLSKSRIQFRNNYAVLNIRRAEVRLTECFWIKLFLNSTTTDNLTGDERVHVTSKAIRNCLGIEQMLIADGLGGSEWSIDGIRKALHADKELRPMMTVPPRISECCRKAFESGDKWKDEAKRLLLQVYGSTLDEAVALLDQGERQLSGYSQSNLWWSRLHTLRLRVYGLLDELGEAAAMSLSLRKFAPDIGIYSNFTNSLRIARHDDFRKLRAIRYFLDANKWHFRFAGGMRDSLKIGPMSSLLPDSMSKAKSAFEELWKKHITEEKLIEIGAMNVENYDAKTPRDKFRFECAILRLAQDFQINKHCKIQWWNVTAND